MRGKRKAGCVSNSFIREMFVLHCVAELQSPRLLCLLTAEHSLCPWKQVKSLASSHWCVQAADGRAWCLQRCAWTVAPIM